MNKIFADHVTNTAFFLSMSKKQIGYLIHLNESAWPSNGYHDRHYNGADTWFVTYRALEKKGLVIRVTHDPIKQHGHYEITNTGKIVCQLLAEAGFVSQQSEAEKAA